MKPLSKFLVVLLAIVAVLLIAAGPPNGILNLRLDSDANGNNYSWTNLLNVGTAGKTIYKGDGSLLTGVSGVLDFSTNNFDKVITNGEVSTAVLPIGALVPGSAAWILMTDANGAIVWSNVVSAVVDGDAEYMTNVLLAAINPGSQTTGEIVSNSVVGGVGTFVLVPSPTGGGGGSQTPILQDVNFAQYSATNIQKLVFTNNAGGTAQAIFVTANTSGELELVAPAIRVSHTTIGDALGVFQSDNIQSDGNATIFQSEGNTWFNLANTFGGNSPNMVARFSTNYRGSSFTFTDPGGTVDSYSGNTIVLQDFIVSNTSAGPITASFPSAWSNNWQAGGGTAIIGPNAVQDFTVTVIPALLTNVSWPSASGAGGGSSPSFGVQFASSAGRTNIIDGMTNFSAQYPLVAGVSPNALLIADSLSVGNGTGVGGFLGVTNYMWFVTNANYYGLQFNSVDQTYAISGQQLGTLSSNYSSTIHTKAPGAGTNTFAMCFGGVNDLGLGQTAEAVWLFETNIWAKARADGFIVVAFTVPVGTNGTQAMPTESCSAETWRLNAMIRNAATNWDYLVDVAAIMPPAWAGTQVWFCDGIHYTNYGQQFLALNVSNVLMRPMHTQTTKYEQPYLGTNLASLFQTAVTQSSMAAFVDPHHLATNSSTFTQAYSQNGNTWFQVQNANGGGSAISWLGPVNSDSSEYAYLMQPGTGWTASPVYHQNAAQLQIGADDTVGLDFAAIASGSRFAFYEGASGAGGTPSFVTGTTGNTNNVPIFGNGTNILGVIATNNAQLNYEPYYSGPGTGINGISWAPATNVDIVTSAVFSNIPPLIYYTNTSGSVQLYSVTISNQVAAVAGNSTYTFAVSNANSGGWSNQMVGLSTTITSISMTNYDDAVIILNTNAVLAMTNTSTGTGNVAGEVPSTGQIMTIGNATASGVASLGGNNTFTGTQVYSFSNGSNVVVSSTGVAVNGGTISADGRNITNAQNPHVSQLINLAVASSFHYLQLDGSQSSQISVETNASQRIDRFTTISSESANIGLIATGALAAGSNIVFVLRSNSSGSMADTGFTFTVGPNPVASSTTVNISPGTWVDWKYSVAGVGSFTVYGNVVAGNQ